MARGQRKPCFKKNIKMKKLEKLTERRYNLINKINCIENEIKKTNKRILLKESKNLLNKEGEGFIEGDYYAEDRYYSEIIGVKNIRFCESNLEVKLDDDVKKFLPKKVKIDRGDFIDTYKVVFFYSKSYKDYENKVF